MRGIRAAHFVRFASSSALFGGGLALIGVLGPALAARIIPMPHPTGHQWGTMTEPMIRWLFAVQVLGMLMAMAAFALVLAVLSRRVGYRARDGLAAFVPVLGQAMLVKLLWRHTAAEPYWLDASRARRRRDLPAEEQLSFA